MDDTVKNLQGPTVHLIARGCNTGRSLRQRRVFSSRSTGLRDLLQCDVSLTQRRRLFITDRVCGENFSRVRPSVRFHSYLHGTFDLIMGHDHSSL